MTAAVAGPPAVSLVIAAYGRGPRIGATLDSVLAQSRPPDELIVVDDCCPAGTGAWVAARYPSVRVVRPECNGGTSAARNFGAAAAAGPLLIFLDHDDLLHPHAVATLTGLLAAFPAARAAFADHRYVNTVTGVTYPDHHSAQPAFARMRRVRPALAGPAGRLYRRPLFRALVRGNLLQQPWAVERATFLRLGGFDPALRYCEDWDLYLRVTRAAPVAVSDAVISDHVIDGGNLHLRPDQGAMHRRVLRRLLRSEPADPRVVGPAARKLALYAKADGDAAAAAGDFRAAWRWYLESFAYWPLDAVVAARLALWLPGAARGRGGRP